jgi:DNA-binding Xre family transcriptional regulator
MSVVHIRIALEVRTLIDYSPLWETLKKQGRSQYILIDNGIDKRTMDQLRHNRNITVLTLEKICRILNCAPNDVLTFTDDL